MQLLRANLQPNTRHKTDGWDDWSLFAIPSQQYPVCSPLFSKDIGIQDDDPWGRMASTEQRKECDAHNDIFHFCSEQQVLREIQGWVKVLDGRFQNAFVSSELTSFGVGCACGHMVLLVHMWWELSKYVVDTFVVWDCGARTRVEMKYVRVCECVCLFTYELGGS